ncbi:hypothetical protein D6833_09265, partial [Candidatus Parcubacteria bacterium]
MLYKILYAQNRARLAGTERHVLYLLDHLNRKRFEPSVVCFMQGPLVEVISQRGVPAFALPRKRVFDYGHFRELRQLIKDGGFDLVHSHSGQWACLAARTAGVTRTIETRHGLCLDYNAAERHAVRNAVVSKIKAAHVSMTVVVSQADYRIMHEKYRIPAERLRCVLNGIDPASVQVSASEKQHVRAEFGSTDSRIVGCVSRLESQKGLEYLIRAMVHL